MESRYANRYDTRPRIPFELGGSSFIGICDLNSNINILSYHAYELISYFNDDPELNLQMLLLESQLKLAKSLKASFIIPKFLLVPLSTLLIFM
jgi:hypothetical protein